MQRVSPSPSALQEARDRVHILTKVVEDIRAQAKRERDEGLPSVSELERQTAEARQLLEQVSAETQLHKDTIKRYRKEIDQWNQWYHGQPGIDREVQRGQLQHEFNWRMAEISRHEAQIAALVVQEYNLTARVEMLQAQLTALREGVLDQPLEADPRLTSAVQALDAARAELTALENQR